MFRKCKIETWLDEIDIQHGDSWLKAIFEDGISKCDFVFVYISENSLKSSMVEKEIDASIIMQLKQNDIKLLPYVSDSEIRGLLRVDLQAIQMPVLDENNFDSTFPIIISNIWNHYYKQKISKIIREKDLEIENLELKMKMKKNEKEIVLADDKEFGVIFTRLNKDIKIEFSYSENSDDSIKKKK
ncbi:toll/interleukin-1 receptor domain-containing protein [Brucepastera parasyntrophica]|uniref:toll/interleukin-1 receptor domain-containing protein n=1 Tax=Brucepastera parasyntrophica TaxID=2880008 RepID=UPI002109FAA0|nr:toll/interleukin-1 receptor domain-containing protein [Brucepastera parasyntrophica]ULQ61042.1 toll/interleukin-1 receptor domain-containing protein [Brucepastera parasyntrophica]